LEDECIHGMDPTWCATCHRSEAAADRAGVSPGSMPEIGRAIADDSGLRRGSYCDSTGSMSGGGSTVTAVGHRVMIDSLGVL
jgi:hypothetical protein